jgi:hypothetical protein
MEQTKAGGVGMTMTYRNPFAPDVEPRAGAGREMARFLR